MTQLVWPAFKQEDNLPLYFTLEAILLLISLGTLIFLVYNISFYVILQKRSSIFITTFYVKAVLIVILDLVWGVLRICGTHMFHKILYYVSPSSTDLEILALIKFVLSSIKCLQNSGPVTSATLQDCRPQEPGWQQNDYDYAVRGYRMLLANIYMYYIEVFLYIAVGAAQLAAMGDLTKKITESVRGIYTRDEGCYDKCIGRISSKSLTFFVLALSACINICGLIILFKGCFEGFNILSKSMFMAGEANFIVSIADAYKMPLTMVTMLVLSTCLLLYFIHM